MPPGSLIPIGRPGFITSQRLQIRHLDAPVAQLKQPLIAEVAQRAIDPLTRESAEITQFLLGDAQPPIHARIEHGMEHGGHGMRHTFVRTGEPVDLQLANELSKTLIELVDDETVELQAAVEQPEKSFRGQ